MSLLTLRAVNLEACFLLVAQIDVRPYGHGPKVSLVTVGLVEKSEQSARVTNGTPPALPSGMTTTVAINGPWTDSLDAHDTDPETGRAVSTQSWAWTTTGDVVVRDRTDGVIEYTLIRQTAILSEDPRWIRRQGRRLPDVLADSMEDCEVIC